MARGSYPLAVNLLRLRNTKWNRRGGNEQRTAVENLNLKQDYLGTTTHLKAGRGDIEYCYSFIYENKRPM